MHKASTITVINSYQIVVDWRWTLKLCCGLPGTIPSCLWLHHHKVSSKSVLRSVKEPCRMLVHNKGQFLLNHGVHSSSNKTSVKILVRSSKIVVWGRTATLQTLYSKLGAGWIFRWYLILDLVLILPIQLSNPIVTYCMTITRSIGVLICQYGLELQSIAWNDRVKI